MFDITERVALDADLDAVLAVPDDAALALCERCLSFVNVDDSGEDEATGETICAACHVAAEAAYERTVLDPQLHAWHEQRERERAAMPTVIAGVSW